MNRRSVLAGLMALMIGWSGGSATAQSTIPSGVFVQDGSGWMWLVIDGQRVNIPVWPATDDEVKALPRSDRWAVTNDAGAIVPGDPPLWLVPGGDAPISGQRAQPSVPGVSPTDPGKPIFLDGVQGQQAVGTFSGQQVRATVTSMLTTQMLRSTRDATRESSYQFDDRWPSGTFVVVVALVENIGTQPVCCLPGYRLKDARGRFFSGEVQRIDPKVRHAYFWFGGDGPTGADTDDLQPNLPKRRVLVYDIPSDAASLTLTPDR